MRGDSSGQCRVGTGKRGAGMQADRGVGMRADRCAGEGTRTMGCGGRDTGGRTKIEIFILREVQPALNQNKASTYYEPC